MPNQASSYPFFECVKPRTLATNIFYRAYVLPGELIFIRSGSSEQFSRGAAEQFGLVGALISAVTSTDKQNQRRREVLNNSTLEELVNDHKHNFRLRTSELQSAAVDPRSFFLAMFYAQPTHVGVLRLSHPDRGKITLTIETADEVKKALAALVPVFRERLDVNIEWNQRKNRFVRKN